MPDERSPKGEGKAYANRKRLGFRAVGDFYPTPRSLVWVMQEFIIDTFSKQQPILEPCSGRGAISEELESMGYRVICNDISTGGVDYLQNNFASKAVITNPPFSFWDLFVEKAKEHATQIMLIGRLNYFGTNSRFQSGIWENLKSVHCFNRYVDYQTLPRKDGHFHVGAMATAWFYWEAKFMGAPTIHVVDVQKYATLGGFSSYPIKEDRRID